MPLRSNQDLGQSHSTTDSAPFPATDANKVEQLTMQSSKASDNLDITTDDECQNTSLNNKKSEQGTLCDEAGASALAEASKKVSGTPNSEDIVATNSNPNPIPSIRRMKITEKLNRSLVPRIKLNFIVGCLGDFFVNLCEEEVKFAVRAGFLEFKSYRKKNFSLKDIHVRYLWPHKMIGENLEIFAAGSIFIRDRDLKSMKLVLKCQEKLLEKLRTFQVKFNDIEYQVRMFSPAFSEDPGEMLASISDFAECDVLQSRAEEPEEAPRSTADEFQSLQLHNAELKACSDQLKAQIAEVVAEKEKHMAGKFVAIGILVGAVATWILVAARIRF